ncbi:MAG TPA: hypothetical protein VL984_12055 [Acidimicrobiales bacterium]|nr:hypothetical protein [Acidimicrobiales bacterium]
MQASTSRNHGRHKKHLAAGLTLLPASVLAASVPGSAWATEPSVTGPALARPGVLQVTGAVRETVKLDRANCTSEVLNSPGNGTMDLFDVAVPSVTTRAPTFVLTAMAPNPKSVYYTSTSTAVHLVVSPSTTALGWYHEWQTLPTKVPASQLHFAANARSGLLDLNMSPQSGASGTVHVSVSWSSGTCGTAHPEVVAT